MSNIKFTDTEKEKIYEILTSYTNLNNLATSLKNDILNNKEFVAEVIDKLKENENEPVSDDAIGNIITNYEQHMQSLNGIVEEINNLKVEEGEFYKNLATKYDVEVNTIITEVTNLVLQM